MTTESLDSLEKELKKINQEVLGKIPLTEYNTTKKIEVPELIWDKKINFEAFVATCEKKSPYRNVQYEHLIDPYADVDSGVKEIEEDQPELEEDYYEDY
ncbi:hypothetical protein [Enterococcus alishanensis]